MMKSTSFVLLVCAMLLSVSNAFQTNNVQHSRVRGVSPTSYSTALEMTVLTYGSRKKDFKPGSPLKNAASALGVKPKYSCRKGDCGSCTLSVGGQRIKACVGKVPPEPRLKSLQEKGLVVK